MRIQCRTLFNITATGVTGHYRASKIPFVDRSGQQIANAGDWERARNQQRNWETLTQLISLRTQVFDLTDPVQNNGAWQFEFTVEQPAIYQDNNGDFGTLMRDCEGVPMIVGLEETVDGTVLTPETNVWFDKIT